MCAGGEEGTETNYGELRVGTAELGVETGRWIGLETQDLWSMRLEGSG